jgi:hypothetical protein
MMHFSNSSDKGQVSRFHNRSSLIPSYNVTVGSVISPADLCYKYHEPSTDYRISGVPLSYPPRNLSMSMEGMEGMTEEDTNQDRVVIVQIVKRMNRLLEKKGALTKDIVAREMNTTWTASSGMRNSSSWLLVLALFALCKMIF